MLRGALRGKISEIRKKIKTVRKPQKEERHSEPVENKAELKKEIKKDLKKLDVEEDIIEEASKKWEYRIMMLHSEMLHDGYAKNLLETLNKLGHDGWEVMAVLPETKPNLKTKIFLKREKS